jgi:asparagine synthase (glutamine-hydrolysing)
MCGIAGIFSFDIDTSSIDKEELIRFREQMYKRGPDSAGIWFSNDNSVGLVHRRLSIIDLSDKGGQPMVDNDNGNSIIFNGEIYNYKLLKSQLESKGFRFRTNSDTEVLLKLYLVYGVSMFSLLRGMFSIAFYDATSKQLILARDPFGIKPLYFSNDNKKFRFSSQVKSLIAGGNLNLTDDPAGHIGFLLWGHIPEPFTLYNEVKSLKSGSYLVLNKDGKIFEEEYFSIKNEIINSENSTDYLNKNELKSFYIETLKDTFNSHLVSDVEVGVFNSAGIDSTTIVSFISEMIQGVNRLKTINIGFSEFKNTFSDESELAREVANIYKSNHIAKVFNRDDFFAECSFILDSMDQPTIDGINLFFASKIASNSGLKVVLSGVGNDEVLRGYGHFKTIPKLISIVKFINTVPGFSTFFRKKSTKYFSKKLPAKYSSFFEYHGDYASSYLLRRSLFLPWELENFMDREFVIRGLEKLKTKENLEKTIDGIQNDQLKISALELSWYMKNQLLRDSDWASMAHSLEVRLPFVDVVYFRNMLKLINTEPKINKLKLSNLIKDKIPPNILKRTKSGFSVPVNSWTNNLANPNKSNDSRLSNWAMLVKSSFK